MARQVNVIETEISNNDPFNLPIGTLIKLLPDNEIVIVSSPFSMSDNPCLTVICSNSFYPSGGIIDHKTYHDDGNSYVLVTEHITISN